MPEKLDEKSVKQLCGEMYNENIFHFLKEEGQDGGRVDRAQFLQIAMDVIEQEVFHLFCVFCPEGDMDETTCKAFFRNAKMLAKKDFPVGKAVEMFRGLLKEDKSTMRYTTLRFDFFPLVASAKDLSMENFMLRLSRSDEPVKEEVIKQGQDIIDSVKLHDEFSPDEELARIKAALALQRASRPIQAKEDLKRLKELKQFEVDVSDYSALAVKTHDGPEEQKCEAKFLLFARVDDLRAQSTDIKIRDYLQLLYASNLIPVDVNVVNFTAKDARHIFNVTVMKFFNKAAGSFADGVSHGKRVSYGVFRNLMVPDIAEKTGRSVEEVVSAIASDEVTVPQIVSSHEDHSTRQPNP